MPGVKRDFYDVCPFCWTVRVKRRIFKSPKYLCEFCGKTFTQKKRVSNDQIKLFRSTVSLLRLDTGMVNITTMGIIRSAIDEVKRDKKCVK